MERANQDGFARISITKNMELKIPCEMAHISVPKEEDDDDGY